MTVPGYFYFAHRERLAHSKAQPVPAGSRPASFAEAALAARIRQQQFPADFSPVVEGLEQSKSP
jgi:hypothetical protein